MLNLKKSGFDRGGGKVEDSRSGCVVVGRGVRGLLES